MTAAVYNYISTRAQFSGPIVQNIVATVSFGNAELDLRAIALNARNCEYNPKRFAAVIMRNRDATAINMKTTALIFRTGKIVITGSKSEEFA